MLDFHVIWRQSSVYDIDGEWPYQFIAKEIFVVDLYCKSAFFGNPGSESDHFLPTRVSIVLDALIYEIELNCFSEHDKLRVTFTVIV